MTGPKWLRSDLQDATRYSPTAMCLQPDPVPLCYSASQALANKLLFEGSNGIVYPSARRHSGTCVACFRPALVFHLRRCHKYLLKMEAGTDTVESQVQPAEGSEGEKRKTNFGATAPAVEAAQSRPNCCTHSTSIVAVQDSPISVLNIAW